MARNDLTKDAILVGSQEPASKHGVAAKFVVNIDTSLGYVNEKCLFGQGLFDFGVLPVSPFMVSLSRSW